MFQAISDRRIRTSLVTMLCDLMLTLFRIGLAILTGSAAMLADAYHSVSDLSLSIIFLISMVFRFKQEKKGCIRRIERARKVESIIVIGASLFILYLPIQAISDLHRLSSDSISNIWLGIFGVIGVMACVYLMARLKVHVGRQTDSLSLEADGYHSMVDFFTSGMVLISLIGFLIGINFDDVVAVLIALLIALSGVELLISGIRSLIRGGEFDQLSLKDLLVQGIRNLPVRQSVKFKVATLRQRTQQHRTMIFAGLLVAYLFTGFTQVPLGYNGVRQLLSRTTTADLQAGLHYALPVPFGDILLIPQGDIRSVTVGSTRSGYTRTNGQNLWFEIVSSRSSRDDTDYIQTGDENLIFLQLTVQYRLEHEASIVHDYQDIDAMLSLVAETALWQQTAMTKYDTLLESSHRAFAGAVSEQIQSEMAMLGVPTHIVGITVHSIQPPAALVAVYRDVLNAHQESQDVVNQAIAQRLHSLPVTRADVNRELADIESAAIEKVLKAQGDIQRFGLLAEAWQSNPAAFEFEQQRNTWVSGFSGQSLTITDPRFDKNDYRVWGAPLMLPAEPVVIEAAEKTNLGAINL